MKAGRTEKCPENGQKEKYTVKCTEKGTTAIASKSRQQKNALKNGVNTEVYQNWANTHVHPKEEIWPKIKIIKKTIAEVHEKRTNRSALKNGGES